MDDPMNVGHFFPAQNFALQQACTQVTDRWHRWDPSPAPFFLEGLITIGGHIYIYSSMEEKNIIGKYSQIYEFGHFDVFDKKLKM